MRNLLLPNLFSAAAALLAATTPAYSQQAKPQPTIGDECLNSDFHDQVLAMGDAKGSTGAQRARYNMRCDQQYALGNANTYLTVVERCGDAMNEKLENDKTDADLGDLKLSGDCLPTDVNLDQCRARWKRISLEFKTAARQQILANNRIRAELVVQNESNLRAGTLNEKSKIVKRTALNDMFNAVENPAGPQQISTFDASQVSVGNDVLNETEFKQGEREKILSKEGIERTGLSDSADQSLEVKGTEEDKALTAQLKAKKADLKTAYEKDTKNIKLAISDAKQNKKVFDPKSSVGFEVCRDMLRGFNQQAMASKEAGAKKGLAEPGDQAVNLKRDVEDSQPSRKVSGGVNPAPVGGGTIDSDILNGLADPAITQ